MKREILIAIAILLAPMMALAASNFDARGGNVTNVSVFTSITNGTLDLNGGTLQEIGNLSISYNLTCSGEGYAATTWGGNYIICTYQNASSGSGTVGPSTSGYVALFNSTTTITGSANLCFNQTTGYLGVGTCTPGARLDVNGDVQIGGNFISYGAATNDFSAGPTKTGDLNVTGYLTVDTPSATDCVDLAAGGSFCSNSTCAWIESPNGVTKVVACN